MFDETVFNRIAGGLSDLDKSIKALNDNITALRKQLETAQKPPEPIDDLTEYDIGVPLTKRMRGPQCFPEPWQFPRGQ